MLEYGGVIISDAAFIFPENEFLKCSLEDDCAWEKWECPFGEGITGDLDSISENLCPGGPAALIDMEYDHEIEDPHLITQTKCCNGHTIFLRSTDSRCQREAFFNMVP